MIKYCEKCFKEGRKNCPTGYSYGWKDEVRYCLQDDCGGLMIDIDFPREDLYILLKTSTDKNFIEAMIKLKQDDIIDYNLKMAQFRNQLEQQKQMEQVGSNDNIPKCPYCNSTNLKKISTGEKVTNIALFGLLGNKRKYQWHCNSCKSDF